MSLLAKRTQRVDSSGIRRIFELARSMKDPINLSIGQPDFDVPDIIKSAAINAMLVNAALSFQAGNFFAATQANPMQVCRFFIGDILGAATVITILATMLLPILRQTKEPLR